MKAFNYQTGRQGEEIARQYLITKGFEIIEHNFRTRFGEIDIIAADRKTLVFVEVKVKIGDQFGSPEEMIGPGKRWQIRQMAEVYLQQNPQIAISYPQQRLDAVCIINQPKGKPERITHYENIE